MTERITLHPLLTPDQTDEQQHDIARGVQKFVYEDTKRLGVDPATARTVANPDNPDKITWQLDQMRHPPVAGTRYVGVHTLGESWEGVVKVGPWLYGDEEMFEPAPYTKKQKLILKLGQFITPLERRPVGLHAFAVREGLGLAALRAVQSELVPATAPLVAAVHVNDDELHEAFTELGAIPDGPTGVKTIGEYTASYVLRELPPIAPIPVWY